MTEATQTTETLARRSGILLIVAGLSLAALTGALMKLLTDEMSPFLVSWFRFTGYFLIMVPLALARVGPRAFRPPRPGIQVIRGVLLALGNVSFMFGVVGLDYANAIAILYIYPFLMTLFAPVVLGERVALAGWLGVLGGFTGVLIVIRPNPADLDVHALLVLATGCMVAVQMLMNRKLGVIADPAVISMWGALSAALVLLLALPWVWGPVTLYQLGILAFMALTSAASQTMMILALSRAQASDLAPYTYSEIVSAVLIGLVIFGTLPDALAWAGMGLITLSGVAVARAQSRLGLRRQPKI